MIVGNLIVKIGGDMSGLSRAFSSASSSFRNVGSAMARNATKIAAGFAAMGAAVAAAGAAILSAANSAADYADTIDKTAIRTGLARDKLQELGFVADQLGTPFSAIENAIRGFTRQLVTIETGTSEASRQMEKLGVNIYDAGGQMKDMSTLFPEVVKALADMTNKTERNAIALTILGRGGQAMIPVLDAGADTIDRLTEKAREMGLVLEDEGIAALVAYKDEMAALQKQLDVEMARAIAGQIDKVTALGRAWISIKTATVSAAGGFVEFGAAIGRGASDFVNWSQGMGYEFGQFFERGEKDMTENADHFERWAQRLQQTAANLRRGAFYPTPDGKPIATPDAPDDTGGGGTRSLAGLSANVGRIAGSLADAYRSGITYARTQQTEVTNVTDATLEAIQLTVTLEQMEARVAEAARKSSEASKEHVRLLADEVRFGLVEAMYSFGRVAADTFVNLITLSTNLRDALASIGNVVKSVVANILSIVATAGIATALTAIPGLGAAGFFTKFGIPFFAEGGIVTRPTLGVIGERGPEAIVPLSKALGMGGDVIVQGQLDVSFSKFHVRYETWKRNRGLT